MRGLLYQVDFRSYHRAKRPGRNRTFFIPACKNPSFGQSITKGESNVFKVPFCTHGIKCRPVFSFFLDGPAETLTSTVSVGPPKKKQRQKRTQGLCVVNTKRHFELIVLSHCPYIVDNKKDVQESADAALDFFLFR